MYYVKTINLGWRERNQQDATNLMFIIKLLSQHVSGIIMPIIRRTTVCTDAYGVLHWLWWLWLCGAGTRVVCTVKVTVRRSQEPKTINLVYILTLQMAPFRTSKCHLCADDRTTRTTTTTNTHGHTHTGVKFFFFFDTFISNQKALYNCFL